MLRFLKIIFLALIIFVLGDFLYYNSNSQALSYNIQFRLFIPPRYFLESSAIPVGLLLLSSFCLGMVFAAFNGAISIFYRSREIKAKNRTIRELEKEIEEMRTLYSSMQHKNQTPDYGRLGTNSDVEVAKID
ncbi:MAG: LapA family protein [Deltaproteobacteria bacterium]|nr:LapA family protein [Deltaproteobacteria bacterium]